MDIIERNIRQIVADHITSKYQPSGSHSVQYSNMSVSQSGLLAIGVQLTSTEPEYPMFESAVYILKANNLDIAQVIMTGYDGDESYFGEFISFSDNSQCLTMWSNARRNTHLVKLPFKSIYKVEYQLVNGVWANFGKWIKEHH